MLLLRTAVLDVGSKAEAFRPSYLSVARAASAALIPPAYLDTIDILHVNITSLIDLSKMIINAHEAIDRTGLHPDLRR